MIEDERFSRYEHARIRERLKATENIAHMGDLRDKGVLEDVIAARYGVIIK
jgi:hypothetical protein